MQTTTELSECAALVQMGISAQPKFDILEFIPRAPLRINERIILRSSSSAECFISTEELDSIVAQLPIVLGKDATPDSVRRC
jgi:hypothetical protein